MGAVMELLLFFFCNLKCHTIIAYLLAMKYGIVKKLSLCFMAYAISYYPVFGQSEQTTEIQNKWIEYVNSGNELKAFYDSHSGILQQNQLVTGIERIAEKWFDFIELEGSITDYKSLGTFQLREGSKFELGEYHTEKGVTYYTVIGWRNKDGWHKEIEVTYAAYNPGPDKSGTIDSLRSAWQRLANDHRPDLIGKDLYVDGGYYFNRGRVYLNKQIADVYSYMDPKTFSIQLDGLSSTMVNEQMAYDIGTFQTSGKGLYILIWIKTKGEWKLLLDFNFRHADQSIRDFHPGQA